MRDRTVNRVESWDARPFSGGFATLRDLADASFSGVVVSGDAWLFMLNGRVVGIVDGDIDDFEEASGTMFEAPDPSLPLLFSMQERGGQSQAKYYTNDTPLEEADRTLSDANFTGFVELSENVLSGDYYLVYYGGRVLPVAFVGTTDELKTGDEAYDLACDEVGVYEVIKTPVNVTQVPGPAEDGGDTGSSGAAGGAAGAGSAASASSNAETSGSGTGDVPESADSTADSSGESSTIPDAESTDDTDSAVDESVAESAGSPPSSSADSSSHIESANDSSTADTTSRPTSDRKADTTTGTTTDTVAEQENVGAAEDAGATEDEDTTTSGTQARSEDSPEHDDTVFSEEEQWRQTKSIPSLSPSEREKRRQERRSAARSRSEQSAGGTPESAGVESDSPSRGRQTAKSTPENADTQVTGRGRSQPGTRETSRQSSTESPTESTTRSEPDSGTKGQDANEVSEHAGTTAEPAPELQERIDELESQIETLDSERDSLSSDLDSVREERDGLKKRVRELEQALEDAGGEAAPGPVLSPDDALAGTNLFVRYGSKGQPTLDELSGKNPDREAINKNLRIDHHTQFEAKEATVDGRPFQAFLEESSSYRFVSWLVRELPYEILDSGQRSGLGDFYNVVSEIDRAELQGVVEVETEEGGQERREFDIVLRDRMGNPLVVAELNDERDPVSGSEMESLVESARVVGDGADDLGAAFYVTASFFEPDALENAGAATSDGGILSRSDRMSYVKLARKQGFHLCLTEDRNETFHLTVPEL